MSTGLEIVDLTEIVGEHDIPCDYSDRRWHGGTTRKAKWVMTTVVCVCGRQDVRLACQECKDLLLAVEDAVKCPGCDELYIPARLAYSHIEAL